jgi:hypothetical protein
VATHGHDDRGDDDCVGLQSVGGLDQGAGHTILDNSRQDPRFDTDPSSQSSQSC